MTPHTPLVGLIWIMMPVKTSYSIRKGTNPHLDGLPLNDVLDLFVRVWDDLSAKGYTHEFFGYWCVDAHDVEGKLADPELALLLATRKRKLWPIRDRAEKYSEDDFFDVIEFLHEYVSKPISGQMHTYDNCGMHWEKFNKPLGQKVFRDRVNEVLAHYGRPFFLTEKGEIEERPQKGFERLLEAAVPAGNDRLAAKIESAITLFRQRTSSPDDRRRAVRDLADVLERLRPHAKTILPTKDEAALFNIANNFGIRHDNNNQFIDYDAVWLSWMFYFYLATIHVLLRKKDKAFPG